MLVTAAYSFVAFARSAFAIIRRLPWQNGYAERLIGSIRRECLSHIVVTGEQHLRHILKCYMQYYNAVRTHLSLGNDAPIWRDIQCAGRIGPIIKSMR
jgi:transposase InsO family protein